MSSTLSKRMDEPSTGTGVEPMISTFHSYNMIVTLLILAVDWLLLTLNGFQYLENHLYFLVFLTLLLRYSKQPSKYQLSQGKDKNNCSICKKAKPPRYHHCRTCKKCFFMMDHHCSFVGVCIAQYNYKVYVHYLINVFIHSLFILLKIIINYEFLFQKGTNKPYLLILLLPALYLTYQSIRLLLAFYETLKHNQTLIETFKHAKGPQMSVMKCVQTYYFGSNKLYWIIPTFVSNNQLNLLQEVKFYGQQPPKEKKYADEYLYGSDSEEELEEQSNNRKQ